MSESDSSFEDEQEISGSESEDQETASASSYDEDSDYGDDEGDEGDDAPEATGTVTVDTSGPSITVNLLRNGDFPARVTMPEGSTGRDLTKYLMENRDQNGNPFLRNADATKQTYLDDNGSAHGPNDVLTDGLLLNSVSKLGGASA